MYLFMLVFFLFTATFAVAIVSAMDSAETAGNIANLMFSLCLIFCGYVDTLPIVAMANLSVLVSSNSLPGFWIFMYRVSPFTYFVEGILSTAVANTPVRCGEEEYQVFNPPSRQTCGAYMEAYQSFAGGYLVDENATTNCQFCQIDNTNVFLTNFGIEYSNRWRDFGIIWAFIIFNVFAAIFLYWIARVVSFFLQG